MRFFYKFYCLFFVLILSASLLQGCGDAFEQSEVITAEIENCYTKTWYDGDGINQKVKWELGDTIKVNNQLLVAKELSDGDKKAYFYPADGGKLKIKSPFVAVYPHTIMEDDGKIAIPKYRRFSEENVGYYYSPMYAQGESCRLLFRNICGVIGLNVKGEEDIISMRLSSDSGAMAGSVIVENGISAVSQEFSNTGVEYEFEKTYKLSSGGGVIYFAVPPREYNVIKIFMIAADGKTADYRLAVNDELRRNRLTMYDIEPNFEEDPFKKELSPKGAISCAVIDGRKKMIEFSSGDVFYNFGDYMKTRFDFQTADIYINENPFRPMLDVNSYNIVYCLPWHAFSGKETRSQRKQLDYSIFSDAGQYFGDGKTWFTLSADEWDFIFNDTRRGSRIGDCEHARYFFSQVQYMSYYNKLTNYPVVAILPDTFDWPSGIKVPVNINNSYENLSNYYTYEEWKELESLGIVILRLPFDIDPIKFLSASFWSSTSCDEKCAYCITLSNGKGINAYHRIMKGDYRHYEDLNTCAAYANGVTYSAPHVRLVKIFDEE